MRTAALVGCALLAAVLAGPARANHGAFDTTFGSAGFATTDFGGDDFLSDLAVQPFDRKIVAVGTANAVTSPPAGLFAAARYTENGTPDSSFSGDGKQAYGHFSGPGGSRSFADRGVTTLIQPDGRILLAGKAVFPEGPRFALLRIMGLSDPARPQALDTSFAGGQVITNVSSLSGDQTLHALALQSTPNGLRIIAAGTAAKRFALVRYTLSGNRDGGFGGGNGIVIAKHFVQGGEEAVIDEIQDVAVQPDGKIVAVGTTAFAGRGGHVAIARFTRDGNLDTSFGSGGRVIFSEPGSTDDRALAVALLSDGRIVVAGVIRPGSSDSAMWLARYTDRGALDPTFVGVGGRRGNTFTNTSSSGFEFATDMFVNSLGQYVSIGFASSPCYPITQHNPGGGLDPGFGGGDGIQFGCFSSSPGNQASAIEPQPNGFMVAGGTRTNGPNSDWGLARFHGARDTTRPRVALRIRTKSLRRLRRTRRLSVTLGVSEAARITLTARATVPGVARSVFLASERKTVHTSARMRIALRVPRRRLRAVRGRERLPVRVTAVARDAGGNRRVLKAKGTLK